MKRLFGPLLTLLLMAGCRQVESPRTVEDFNFDWRFTLGDDEGYAAAEFDDSSWRQLHLPHDWSIEGVFDRNNPSTEWSGALPGGVGWYRKRFPSPRLDGRVVNVEFDGIFMNGTVYVNGHKVGSRPYGYSSVSYDITPYLNAEGEDNAIAVRCDNSEQPNSRWYAGCGIYRNVRLVATSDLFVEYSGTYITTPEVDDETARVHVVVTVTNKSDSERRVKVVNRIEDADGKKSRKEHRTVAVAAGESLDVEMDMAVASPHLWDVDDPHMYTMHTMLQYRGVTLDEYSTPFGIRTFEFDADRGFSLNGRGMKLKGVCMHHDMGALGTAVHRRALERQLEILRSFGCNAIRTSHNPPAPELLDLCDSMGFLVMDEAFDMWRRAKTQYDYSRYFDAWHERDLVDFVKRDRNHPSIVMWSIGNEILEQWDDRSEEFGDLPIEQQNMLLNFLGRDSSSADDAEVNQNVLMTRHLVSTLKEIDATRPVTAGCNETRPMNNLLRSGALDIVGFNYHEQDYDSVRVWYPGVPFIGSETASALNSRGFYLNPSSELHVMPERWDLPYDTAHHQCSAYDHCRAPWATLHETAWIAVRDRDYAAGTFVWTGFDYLGEPTPYSWPSRSSYFGIVDLCGFPKDCYYMYRSEWTDEPTLHLFPHWNWSEGDKVDVWAYYNTADEVELLVNGRSLGRSAKTPERLHALWEGVRFEPGEITAVAYKDGEEIMRQTRRTAGEAVGLTLTPDRERIAADGYDLSFVTIDAVDADGCFMPTAMNALRITVGGAGELVGVDNGDATSHDSLKGGRIRLFNGKALAIVRSIKGVEGEIVLRVEGDGLQSSAVTVTSI